MKFLAVLFAGLAMSVKAGAVPPMLTSGADGNSMAFKDGVTEVVTVGKDGSVSASNYVKIGENASTCDASLEGAIRYNSTSKKLELCNGSSWGFTTAGDPGCTPASFNFPTTNASVSSVPVTNTSSIVQMTGLSCAALVSVAGDGAPEYRVCADASCNSYITGWTSAEGSIENNQYLQLRQTAAGLGNQEDHTATITVGSLSSDWLHRALAKLVFVTSTTYTGNLGGVTDPSGADAKCQSVASAAGHTGTFKAWVSADGSNSPWSPISTFVRSSIPYVRADGAQVASNWTDLTDGTLSNPINVTESAAASLHNFAWTHTVYTGQSHSGYNGCMSFTGAGTGTSDRAYGARLSLTSSAWSSDGLLSCYDSHPVICFEQ